MPLSAKVSGTWEPITSVKARVAGTWESVKTVKVRVAGVWELVWAAITLVGGSFADFVISPGTATAQYRLLNTGEEQGNNGGGWFGVGTWLGAGSASDYEVRYSPTGDTGDMVGNSINTWLSLSSGAVWGISRSSFGSSLVSGTIEIRDATSLAVLASATVQLRADVDI